MIVAKTLDMTIFTNGYYYSETIGNAHDQLARQEMLK